MAEYIEREALLAHIKDLPTWRADAGGVYGSSLKYPEGMFDCEDVVSSVENAPAADVAPVVYCKDCAYHHWEQEPCHGRTVHYCGIGSMNVVSRDSFCSYGVKKCGNENRLYSGN